MPKYVRIFVPALLCASAGAQEIVQCGEGSYASYAPWRLARSTRHWGDQSRIMQNRPVYLSPEMAAKVAAGEPIPTNDWWTDALVSRWTGNLWSYPAKVRIDSGGVRVAFPSYWIADGTEMKERSALVVGAAEDFNPSATLVAGWHDWDVEMDLRDGEKRLRATLVHGSPFTWVESTGVKLRISIDNAENLPVSRRKGFGGEVITVGGDVYGVWTGSNENGEWAAIALAPDEKALEKLAPYASAVIRSTRVEWKYNEASAELTTTWRVATEDLSRKKSAPVALQGFLPHHLKRTDVRFDTIENLVWQTPRGKLRAAAGNSLSIVYPFAGMLPYWAVPGGKGAPAFDQAVFDELFSAYAAKGTFGGDTYWGGKGLLQMAFAMAGARERGDEAVFRAAHAKLRAKFEDWLSWEPGEERFFFSYVPKWRGLVGEGTSYDSDAFNDHHFHYGYFTYAGALLCMVDGDFAGKFGPMLEMIAKDYANWDRRDKRFPFFRTFDPWAGHSFAGGLGDGNGNGQESSSEAMQGWGGLFLLGLALGDEAMRDAAIFGYVSEARGIAEYWFDRDRENIDYTKFSHPYNSNLTCHGVGWWTYFSGDPVWMHSIQWLPNTPALDYLSEDLKFAKWDWETMWRTKEIGGWFEKGKTRDGHETPPVGNESLGNVLLSYFQRHDPAGAARIFDELRKRKMGAAVNVDTAHMTYWVVHSHLQFGELDFSLRADYPCARAFVKDGARTFMAFNTGRETRKVRFFDGDGRLAGTLDAAPGVLSVSGRASRAVAKIAGASAPARLVPKGVEMEDLARGRRVDVSSRESDGLRGENIVDGDDATRWSSAHDDAMPTATIDLGRNVELYASEIKWENSYAARYLLEISPDGAKWAPLGGERGAFEGRQRLDFNGEKARFIRMRGLEKATRYGISIFSWRVFGKAEGDAGGILGLAVEPEKPVLKEGEACRLDAKAWLGGECFRPVEAVWASDDGVFDGALFTPATNGFATVRAKAGRLEIAKKLPVEEALKVSELSFAQSNMVAVAGEGVRLGLAAKDQFGGAMPLAGMKLGILAPNGKKATAKDCKLQKPGIFIPLKKGVYCLRAKLGSATADATIAASDLKEANLARLAKVASSGEENASLAAAFAADGDMKTRWSSRHRDGEWISFDFGKPRVVSHCAIAWEAARAESYAIEVSPDGVVWREAAAIADNPGGRQTHSFAPVKARKLRIRGIKRNTNYGISIFEVEIH